MLELQNIRPQPGLSGPPARGTLEGSGGGATKMTLEAAEGVQRVGRIGSKTILTTRRRVRQRRRRKRDR